MLKSLPYLTWVTVEDSIQKSGVTKYNPELSYNGVNIYNNCGIGSAIVAQLINMSGEVVHTWSEKARGWHHVEMCKDGSLLAIAENEVLVKLDWNSEVQWINRARFHHDIAITKSGYIYSLIRKEEIVFYRNLPVPICNDYIVMLSPNGKIKKELSLYDVFEKEIPFKRVLGAYCWILKPSTLIRLIYRKLQKQFLLPGDDPTEFFHVNSIEVINRDFDGVCKKGDLLICALEFDFVGILDIKKKEFVWSWGPGNLDKPHHPTLLENGNILIFDNGKNRDYSRIIELNPVTKNIGWEYRSNPPDKFYTYSRGSSQRLPNGNTLITESNKGHVFEVTKDRKIAWEFYAPKIKKKEKKRRMAIYRMVRITDSENFPRLKELR